VKRGHVIPNPWNSDSLRISKSARF
jgi:hypothetical protein